MGVGVLLVMLISATVGGIVAVYINPDAYSFLGEPALQQRIKNQNNEQVSQPVSYTHLRAHRD